MMKLLAVERCHYRIHPVYDGSGSGKPIRWRSAVIYGVRETGEWRNSSFEYRGLPEHVPRQCKPITEDGDIIESLQAEIEALRERSLEIELAGDPKRTKPFEDNPEKVAKRLEILKAAGLVHEPPAVTPAKEPESMSEEYPTLEIKPRGKPGPKPKQPAVSSL